MGLIRGISATRGQALDPFYLTNSVRDGAEYWGRADEQPGRRKPISAEDLPGFNARIVGLIEAIETFGAKWRGWAPDSWAQAGPRRLNRERRPL